MATEAHTHEQRRLRETLHEVETKLKHVERERQELLITQGTRRATINGLEDELEDMKEELKRTKQELADQRTQYFQLRSLFNIFNPTILYKFEIDELSIRKNKFN